MYELLTKILNCEHQWHIHRDSLGYSSEEYCYNCGELKEEWLKLKLEIFEALKRVSTPPQSEEEGK